MRRWTFLAAAALLPALLAAGTATRGHHGDVAVFRAWYEAARDAPSRIYLTPRGDVNYPALGAAQAVAPGFLSAALTHGAPPSPARFLALEKALLAPWNTAVLLLFAALATALGVAPERARALAVGAWLLPCSWVGMLYFAQLDGVTTALQLASFQCAAVLLLRPSLALAPLAGALGFAFASLLVKPLALFAAPTLLALPLLAIARAWAQGARRDALRGALVALAAALVLVLPDAFLVLPAGVHSHLALAYGAGPPHGDMIGNGPGIFAWLRQAPDASSRLPMAGGLTPRTLGRALFLLAFAALTFLAGRAARAQRYAARETLSAALLHAGGANLAMGTLLAGTHERYLVHAFPLVLLGALGRSADAASRALFASTALTGALYGGFVLTTIEWDALAPRAPWLASPRPTAVAALALLATVLRELARRGRAAREAVVASRASPP